jgi:hypothetical protein
VAKAWEQLIFLGDRAAPLVEYPAGFDLLLPGSPSAFVSDSSGPNVRARAIASLRHPGVVLIPCFSHIFALLCGDYLTASRYITPSPNISRWSNSLTHRRHCGCALLRVELSSTLGTSLALVQAVASRWTSTWLSACSVLQVQDALVSVLTATAGKERVQEAMVWQSPRFKALRDVVAIVCDPSFFDDLGAHLDAMFPTIEFSLVWQGGSATLADARYCFSRGTNRFS